MSLATPPLLYVDATREILLVHTAIDLMGIAVSVVLLRALVALQRYGEALPGMLLMISFMLTAELLRLAWLAFLWWSVPAPLLLDVLALLTGFIVLVGLPIIGSARYFPKLGADSTVPRLWAWLQRGMVVTALLGFSVFVTAAVFRVRLALLMGPVFACMLTAAFLVSRFSFYRHLQVRRRPQVLFVTFVASGLLLSAFVAAFSVVSQVRIRQSLPLALLNASALVLVLCGLVFLFANIRQADLIVKRTMRIVLWTCMSLLAWLVLMHVVSASSLGGSSRDAFVLSLLFGVAFVAPPTERRLNHLIDRWIFEQYDMQGTIAKLWGELLRTESTDEAFSLTETFLRDGLSLAAVQIEALDGGIDTPGFRSIESVPQVPAASRRLLNATAGIQFPLFVDGSADYVIVLKQGKLRPALTQWEMDIVERVAGRLQVWLGTRSAADRARREAAQQQELAGAELRALRAQVNPHFLFNSLNTIADLAAIAPAQAEEMTVRLSSVFRYVLVNTDRHFSSLREELEFARSYLSIEQTRFGDRLRVTFDVDPQTLDKQVPTLLLQPLIENALKHGISPRREGGTLIIRSTQDHESICLSVADDGAGLKARTGAERSERSTHVGIDNVISRLRAAYGSRASFRLRQRDTGGTEALVRIPRSEG